MQHKNEVTSMFDNQQTNPQDPQDNALGQQIQRLIDGFNRRT
jgi:hypothetical protein